MRKIGIAAVLALVALGGPVASLAEGGGHDHMSKHDSIEALLVEFADTPAEHQALADYYRDKAAEARAMAADHRSMGKQYAAGKLLQRDAMKAHCEALAKTFDDAAAEYEKLASGHEAEAKH